MGHLQFHLHVNKTNEILCASRTWPTLSPVSQWTALKVALKKWHILNKAPGKWERGLFAGLGHWAASWQFWLWQRFILRKDTRRPSDFLWMPLETLFQVFPGSGLWWSLSDSVSIARLWLGAWWCIVCLSQAQGIVEGKDLVLKQHENFVLCPCDSS